MIRKATSNDVFKIEQIEQAVFGHTLGVEFIDFELSENPFAHYFVISEGDVVVGYIGAHIVDKYASVINFVIDKKYQKKGYGKNLMDYLENICREKQVYSLSLEVRVSNLNAINFYKEYGFIQSHIKKNYYGNEDGILMIKEVKQ